MDSKQFIQLLEQEVEDFVQTQAEKIVSFEDDPMAYILQKYPSLKATLEDLMTSNFEDYITGIYVMAPKPTTFKVLLHNGQHFFLIYARDSYIAKIAGKKYYLLNIGEQEYAIKSIADLLTMGMPPGAEGPDEEVDNDSSAGSDDTPDDTADADDAGGDDDELSEAKEKDPETDDYGRPFVDPKGSRTYMDPDEMTPAARARKMMGEKKIKIIKENKTVLQEASETYDTVIKKGLGLKPEDSIPLAQGSYKLEGGTFDFNVASEDMENFNKLYPLAPPKTGETEGQTKGVGNGEIALYYLYQYQKTPLNVEDGRGDDQPDLIMNGVGVEVKAMKSHTGQIKLGRFGKDRENLYLLSNIFGLYTLTKTFEGEDTPSINPTNFSATILPTALKAVYDFNKIDNLDELVKTYPQVFGQINKNIKTVLRFLKTPKNEEDAAIATAKRLAKSKLERKPGYNGYLANVLKNGSIKFFKIDESKLEGQELLDNLKVAQSTISLNFGNLFG